MDGASPSLTLAEDPGGVKRPQSGELTRGIPQPRNENQNANFAFPPFMQGIPYPFPPPQSINSRGFFTPQSGFNSNPNFLFSPYFGPLSHSPPKSPTPSSKNAISLTKASPMKAPPGTPIKSSPPLKQTSTSSMPVFSIEQLTKGMPLLNHTLSQKEKTPQENLFDSGLISPIGSPKPTKNLHEQEEEEIDEEGIDQDSNSVGIRVADSSAPSSGLLDDDVWEEECLLEGFVAADGVTHCCYCVNVAEKICNLCSRGFCNQHRPESQGVHDSYPYPDKNNVLPFKCLICFRKGTVGSISYLVDSETPPDGPTPPLPHVIYQNTHLRERPSQILTDVFERLREAPVGMAVLPDDEGKLREYLRHPSDRQRLFAKYETLRSLAYLHPHLQDRRLLFIHFRSHPDKFLEPIAVHPHGEGVEGSDVQLGFFIRKAAASIEIKQQGRGRLHLRMELYISRELWESLTPTRQSEWKYLFRLLEDYLGGLFREWSRDTSSLTLALTPIRNAYKLRLLSQTSPVKTSRRNYTKTIWYFSSNAVPENYRKDPTVPPVRIVPDGSQTGEEVEVFPVGVTTYNDFYSNEELEEIERQVDLTDKDSRVHFPMGYQEPNGSHFPNPSFDSEAHPTFQPTFKHTKLVRTKFFFQVRYLWHSTQLKDKTNAKRAEGIRIDVETAPQWMKDIVERSWVESEVLPSEWLNQYAMNIYHDGSEGIKQHFDDIKRFDRPIYSLRLFSPSRLSFGSLGFAMSNSLFFIPMGRGTITALGPGYAADDIKHCVRSNDMTCKSAALLFRRVYPHLLREAELIQLEEKLNPPPPRPPTVPSEGASLPGGTVGSPAGEQMPEGAYGPFLPPGVTGTHVTPKEKKPRKPRTPKAPKVPRPTSASQRSFVSNIRLPKDSPYASHSMFPQGLPNIQMIRQTREYFERLQSRLKAQGNRPLDPQTAASLFGSFPMFPGFPYMPFNGNPSAFPFPPGTPLPFGPSGASPFGQTASTSSSPLVSSETANPINSQNPNQFAPSSTPTAFPFPRPSASPIFPLSERMQTHQRPSESAQAGKATPGFIPLVPMRNLPVSSSTPAPSYVPSPSTNLFVSPLLQQSLLSSPKTNETVGQKRPLEDSPSTELKRPALNAELQRPALDAEIKKPALNAELKRPALDAELKRPALDELKRPALNAKLQRPALDAELKRPALDELEGPSLDENKENVLPKVTFNSTLPKTPAVNICASQPNSESFTPLQTRRD